jgi:replicative DNA helicase
MPGYELTKQTISRFAEIPEPYLRAKSFMNQEQRVKYENVKKEINWDLLPTEVATGLDVYQVIGRIRRYAKLYPGSIVFIDYLQRIKHDRNKQSFELENISNLIADATRENNITVVLLSQLSNAAEISQEPSIGHLKGSGGIGESADTVILMDNIYRRDKRDESQRGVIQLLLEQRYGDSGKIKILSDLSCCKFYDPSNSLSSSATVSTIKERHYSEVEEYPI